jgi:CheY-like chemotaxis protein
MDRTTLSRAMEPFFTTKGVGKGTGLGLPMVRGLAEQSGGHFDLQSHLGKGTTAELWLPVAEGKKQSDERTAPLDQAAEKAHPPLVILAVDDDSLVLTNTVAMLEDLGHTVIPAASGREALEILRREPAIDVVITDQVMPQMTGQQLAEAIEGEWPDLPVVLATGFAETPPSGVALPRIAKPFTQAELVALMARFPPQRSQDGRVVKFRSGGSAKI